MAISIKQHKAIRALSREYAEKVLAIVEDESPETSDSEIFIIDAAALPAEYYLRESVQAAILDEIHKDYQNTKQLPAGASLKNEVEARSGETQEIPDKTDDSVERGTGSEDPERGADNGSQAGGGDSNSSGQPSESDSERGSESSKGPRQ